MHAYKLITFIRKGIIISFHPEQVWAFHGANDIVVPARATDKMVEALKAARPSGPEVKYTRYDAAPAPTGWEDYTGHASWLPAYAGPELWTWLLEHSKK